MSNAHFASAGKLIDQVVRGATSAPEPLVRAVVRIMESDIFPEGFSEESEASLTMGAKLAWDQLRRESCAFSWWDSWRRAFILGGDAYDRLTLESLRGNGAGETAALLTLAEVDLMLRSCEASHRQDQLKAA